MILISEVQANYEKFQEWLSIYTYNFLSLFLSCFIFKDGLSLDNPVWP